MDNKPEEVEGFYSSSIKIKKEELIALLKCPLCDGIFRTPTTINECMDSFCKSCIYKWFYEVGSPIRDHCPKCKIKLGGRPLDTLIFDSSLSVLVDILFPEFERLDKLNTQKMYKTFRENGEPLLDNNENNNESLVTVHLYPIKSNDINITLPPIVTDILVPKHINISTMKTYLSGKLGISEEEIKMLYKDKELPPNYTLDDIDKLYGLDQEEIVFHYGKKTEIRL